MEVIVLLRTVVDCCKLLTNLKLFASIKLQIRRFGIYDSFPNIRSNCKLY